MPGNTPASLQELANVTGMNFGSITLAPLTSGGNGLYMGSGVPAAGLGINGDYYLRTDTPGTLAQRIYVKSGGSWVNALA